MVESTELRGEQVWHSHNPVDGGLTLRRFFFTTTRHDGMVIDTYALLSCCHGEKVRSGGDFDIGIQHGPMMPVFITSISRRDIMQALSLGEPDAIKNFVCLIVCANRELNGKTDHIEHFLKSLTYEELFHG